MMNGYGCYVLKSGQGHGWRKMMATVMDNGWNISDMSDRTNNGRSNQTSDMVVTDVDKG